MTFLLQQATDDFARLGTDIAGPVQEAFRRPAMHRLMCLRHVLLTGAMGALTAAARMTGHPLTRWQIATTLWLSRVPGSFLKGR